MDRSRVQRRRRRRWIGYIAFLMLVLTGAAAAVLHYRLVCRDFGGTTGDLAGYFLTLCELGILLGATLGQSAMG